MNGMRRFVWVEEHEGAICVKDYFTIPIEKSVSTFIRNTDLWELVQAVKLSRSSRQQRD